MGEYEYEYEYYRENTYPDSDYLDSDTNEIDSDTANLNLKFMLGTILLCMLVIRLQQCFEGICQRGESDNVNCYDIPSDLNELFIREKIDEQCPICLEGYSANKTIVQLNCNHKFHKECIIKWFQTTTINNCPLCRIII